MALRFMPEKEKAKSSPTRSPAEIADSIERLLDAEISAGRYGGGSGPNERCVSVNIDPSMCRLEEGTPFGDAVKKELERRYRRVGWKRVKISHHAMYGDATVFLFH